jgi:8-amino-7-oxononanoate synthase
MRRPEDALTPALQRLRSRQLYRRRRTVTAVGEAARVEVEGRRLIDFCSNDYLGLARDPRLSEAMTTAAGSWGVGSTAAHLVTGHSSAHHALEDDLARFTGRERALLFSTGYMANLGVLSALTGRGDFIAEDRLNHASLIDGVRLSGARSRRYRHADADAAAERLAACEGDGRRLIVTDGVFSMDGDVAPLAALAGVAAEHGAWLVVDDAHGLGVLGENGGGALEAAGLTAGQAPVLVGTLGKALGTFGAFVAGSDALIETLVQRARPYIYTTAPPPAVAEATRVSLQIAAEETWRRERLAELIRRFRAGVEVIGLPLTGSITPIQPVIIGTPEKALQASEALWREGFWVAAIRPPTVPEGSSRLRVTLCASHTGADVDGLVEALAACVPEGPQA